MLKLHPNEILIYYNPESSAGRKTVAHARSHNKNVSVRSFDKGPSTGTIWKRIVDKLEMHPKEMMNKAHPYYQENIRGREFTYEGWLKILAFNPDLIKAPIALRGDDAIMCHTPTDIYKLGGTGV